MGGLQQGYVTGLRRLRGKALLHCERELWGPLEMACSGDLMPSTNPCLPTSSHVAHPQPPMSRPEPPMLPAWTSHGGTPDADACKGAKGLGAGGWRSACGMPILPDSSLPPPLGRAQDMAVAVADTRHHAPDPSNERLQHQHQHQHATRVQRTTSSAMGPVVCTSPVQPTCAATCPAVCAHCG